MKSIKILSGKILALIGLSISISGCTIMGLDLHEDYDYQKSVINNKIDMTAWEYLKSRADGNPSNPTDTVFRWMKKAIDYSGIDTTEYMKPNRTYIFLHNEAIRRVNGSRVLQNNCFFYDFYKIRKNPDGTPINMTTATRPGDEPKSWADYDKETVRKYLLYLIAEGDYNYHNLTPEPVTLQTLLPAGSVATKESKLGYLTTPTVVPGVVYGSSATAPTFSFSTAGGNGFDPEGKLTLQIGNTADSKVYLNGYLVVRSSGYYVKNGSIHVWGTTVWPTR